MTKQPKLKKSGPKLEDKVIMHSCYEARKEKYKDKVWTVNYGAMGLVWIGGCVAGRL
ncbi:hypothetical protein ACDZ28_25525 [Paenibacillus sp. RS8]|uniref:hypothetical protein n=1 Tax=Paenibacillus sp. RS8 TaxID=3242681 RepID=UPI0035C17BC9